MKIEVFTLFPDWFRWFTGQRHVTVTRTLETHRGRHRVPHCSVLAGSRCVVDAISRTAPWHPR